MLKGATQIQLAKILRTLGNQDAIKILRSAKGGFDGTSDAHRRLGLSIKRYYYRLEKLMETGLVTRRNDRYELTPLGTIVCDSMERRVLWAIENVNQLGIIQSLKSAKTIDDEVLKRVAADLFGSEVADLKLGLSARAIQTYEELVDTTIKLTERAVESVYLATRYSDIRAAEAGWRAVRRGINIRLIDSAIERFSGRIKLVQMLISHPKGIKMMYNLFHSDKVQVRYREIPFSFMVVDDKDCCLEILNPAIEGFFAAVEFDDNVAICRKLLKTFENLWGEGEKEDPFVNFSEDLMRRLGE